MPDNPFGYLDPVQNATAQAEPPTSPEEVQQRVSGWQRFLDRLQTDPTLAAGTMRFATQLMQPIAPGQTPLGHFGGALEHSVDYMAAARNAAEKQALERAKVGADVGHTQAQTGAVTQETQQKAVAFPNAMQQAEARLSAANLANRKAQKEIDQITAEEAAGLRSPEFLKRQGEAKQALVEAQKNLYDAHSYYFNMLGKAGQEKAAQTRQILHSTQIANPDGTTSIVNSHAVNGKLYIESYTPPRFTDEAQARLQATQDTSKMTPFFGQAPYTGTKAQEIERRTRSYLTPQRSIIGPNSQPVTPQEFDSLDTPQLNRPPSTLSTRDRALQSQITDKSNAQPETANFDVTQMNRLQKTINDPSTPENVKASLQEILADYEKRVAVPVPAAAGKPLPTGAQVLETQFVRDASGKIQPKGGGGAPNAPAVKPTGVEAAQTALDNARAVLGSYGTLRRRQDPQGYIAAQKAVGDAKKALEAARKTETPNPEAEVAARETPLRRK